MVIEAGGFIVYPPPRPWLLGGATEHLGGGVHRVPTAAALAVGRDNGALPSLAFLLPLAKTDRETQTHRWSRSSHQFERRTPATVASTSSDLETGARRLVSHECRVPGPGREADHRGIAGQSTTTLRRRRHLPHRASADQGSWAVRGGA